MRSCIAPGGSGTQFLQEKAFLHVLSHLRAQSLTFRLENVQPWRFLFICEAPTLLRDRRADKAHAAKLTVEPLTFVAVQASILAATPRVGF